MLLNDMSKIRKSAKGEQCLIRIPGHCNYDPATVVLCHIGGAGLALKSPDMHGAYGCSDCHNVIDGRVPTKHSKTDVKLWFFEGIFRTQLELLKKGLINV